MKNGYLKHHQQEQLFDLSIHGKSDAGAKPITLDKQLFLIKHMTLFVGQSLLLFIVSCLIYLLNPTHSKTYNRDEDTLFGIITNIIIFFFSLFIIIVILLSCVKFRQYAEKTSVAILILIVFTFGVIFVFSFLQAFFGLYIHQTHTYFLAYFDIFLIVLAFLIGMQLSKGSSNFILATFLILLGTLLGSAFFWNFIKISHREVIWVSAFPIVWGYAFFFVTHRGFSNFEFDWNSNQWILYGVLVHLDIVLLIGKTIIYYYHKFTRYSNHRKMI